MTFGDRIKFLRGSRGMSQEMLGEALGLPRSAIAHYETDNPDASRFPRMERLVQISDYFNVTIDYLLGRSDIKEESNIDWRERALKAEKRVSLLEHQRNLIRSLTEGG